LGASVVSSNSPIFILIKYFVLLEGRQMP
jgi:hypothetical protein